MFPAGKEHVDVLIVGAGPVGLTLANVLGLQGVSTLVVDERDSLIDYPRGVGLDDEALRTFQSIGLVEHVLPLRRQPATARRDGSSRCTIRLAQAQRFRPAHGRRRVAARP
jgi:2-polyprenyl-6-methoxyphenol hydroxylase-like FAD-dependent oxidoreductase